MARLAGDRADGTVRLAFCWAHMRRLSHKFHTSPQSPLAAEVLTRIRALYAIEAEIRGHPAEHPQQVLHQQLLRLGQRQTQVSDITETIRPADRHHVDTSELTIHPRCNQS